jgi:hypothetical protein
MTTFTVRGWATPGDQIPGEGHTGGSASNSNILSNLNLYLKRLQAIDMGAKGRILMQKTVGKTSRVMYIKCTQLCICALF